MPYDLKPLINLSRIIFGTRIAKMCQLGSVPTEICGRIIFDVNFFNLFKRYSAFFLRIDDIFSSFLTCTRAIAERISESTKLLPTLTHEYFLLSPRINENLLVPFSLTTSAVWEFFAHLLAQKPPSPADTFLVPWNEKHPASPIAPRYLFLYLAPSA